MDHSNDVKNYVGSPDAEAIAALAKNYKLVLSQPDSQWVAFSDPAELERVKENYLKGKLGLTDSDDLDGALDAVKQTMSGTVNKSRLTVYYLLADHFGKLDVVKAFGS
ncbi:MAG: DUF2853 family protein [Gordonia sp. (in: high G+C Gram-positive bacteria)]|uniref:DUF2853 family protein n=1 Tax=Gordonia sp. (in: high G+C Gram-positive bacteria) TaxID=84139 RepID=UPI0039E6107C